MDVEKRLALCFVLSMLVMIGFNWYYAKMYPDQTRSTTRKTATARSTSQPSLDSQQPTPTPDQTTGDGEELPTADTTPWSWLASAKPSADTSEVVVESDLYRIVFSSQGGIPTRWELLQFPELHADERLLELKQNNAPPAEKKKAILELNWIKHQASGEPPPVNAIDPTFDLGEAGLLLRWGKNITDKSIPYAPSSTQLYVDSEQSLTFSYTNNGITIEKTFRFHPDSYHVEMRVRILNQSGKTLAFEKNGHYDVGWFGGFGFPSIRTDAQNDALIHLFEQGITIQPTQTLISELSKNSSGLMKDFNTNYYTMPLKRETVGWVGVGQKYFLAAVLPKTPTNFAFKGVSSPGNNLSALRKPHAGVRMNIDPILDGMEHVDQYTVYVGPLDEDELIKADSSLSDARQIFWRSFTGPISNFMLKLLKGFYKIVPNYGLAIIFLTLLVKILMLPLYHKQMKSMKKMQALQPQLNALKEQHKDNPQKLQKEQMELFRKHKVNPLAGCLTMLPTLPIFIALYSTFRVAVELRGAPFFGWINDLSAPDSAFFIPIGTYIFTVNILPLAYAVLMLWSTSQQKVEGPNATMMKIFPLMFVFFFWSIASGVILYFVISIFIDVSQRMIMEKFQSPEPLPAGKGK